MINDNCFEKAKTNRYLNIADGDLVNNERWYDYCRAQGMPLVIITKMGRSAKVEFDLITTDLRLTPAGREELASILAHRPKQGCWLGDGGGVLDGLRPARAHEIAAALLDLVARPELLKAVHELAA